MINKKDYKKIGPFKGWVLENFPFIEADFDAITNYQLYCKIVEYLNKVIYNEQLLEIAVDDITDYLNNLDLQDEVNNKLDEMVESGQLQEIIADYLNSKAIFGFDNVESMKQATNLINGSYAKTLGYYNKNDGGESLYKIRNITNDDVVDESFIIALSNNELIAELVYYDEVNILSLGAKNDGIYDNKNIIDNAINKLVNGGKIIFPKGNYATSGTHIIDSNNKLEITGSGKYTTKFTLLENANYLFWCKNMNDHLLVPIKFSNFSIYDIDNSTTKKAFILSDRWGYKLDNIIAYFKGTFCEFYNNIAWTEGAVITNVDLRGCKIGFTCNRNTESETATDSFFNIKIDKCSHNLNQSDARFIDLRSIQNEDYPITAYQWEVNATTWFGSIGGGKRIIQVGNYNTLTGIFNLYQDGTGGIYNGSDLNTITVADNGYFDVSGSLNYLQNVKTSIKHPYKVIQFLKQNTNWKWNENTLPLVRFKGLKIQLADTILANSEEQVIYTSGYLPTYSKFLVTVTERGDNGTRKVEYLVTCSDVDNNVNVSILSNNTGRRLDLRPINNGTSGSYSQNNGLQFEINLNQTITADLKYNIEIEML